MTSTDNLYALKDRTASFMAFETLYWCGLRLGEMLALTPSDFDFEYNVIHVTKSYQRIGGEDIITPPKTDKGIRRVLMPEFFAEEIQQYISGLEGADVNRRIFQFTKSYLHHEMRRGCAVSGVKKIRIHGIRHQYVKHTTKNISLQKQKSQTTNRFDSLGFLFSLLAFSLWFFETSFITI